MAGSPMMIPFIKEENLMTLIIEEEEDRWESEFNSIEGEQKCSPFFMGVGKMFNGWFEKNKSMSQRIILLLGEDLF